MSIFLTTLVTLFIKVTPTEGAPFDTVTLSPLYLGRDSTFVVDTRYPVKNFEFTITNDLYTDKVIAEGITTKRGKNIFTYNNQYTRSNNVIKVRYKQNNTWYTSNPINMSPVYEGYQVLKDNTVINSRSSLSVLTFTNQAWTSRHVRHSFENFNGMYIPNYYHKIDFADFEIYLSEANMSFFTCNPSLVISNVDGVFNDISISTSVEFPLELVETPSGFTFALKDTYYVHKETLLMAKIKKEGYVATKYIFLPRNEMQKQDRYKAYFAMQNFGIDNDFVKHNFELKALKNIIGDCQNSEYCIQRL